MRSYRVSVFDMGHVNAVVQFDAADDDAALEKAKEHFPEEERELWEGNRFVKRLAPNNGP